MKKILFTLLFLSVISGAYAQSIIGTWFGTLNIQGTKLHLVFHIAKTGDTYTTKMDSPDQGASGLATDKTTFLNNQLYIEAAQFGIRYNGNYVPDSSKITGTFKQGAGSFPLTLSANKASAETAPVARPQDPKDFPYKQEEVMIPNAKANVQLAGTLTMPSGGKVSKIVVLISGSGPQNRNEEIVQYNHRPFLVWSDWLTRNGIAVLRYDDRGIGKSTGIFSGANTSDFANDAEAAVNYIASRPDLKHLSIGLMGHSEGGMVAPIVASRNKSVKFIVLLAAPGIPIAQLMVQQNEDIMRLKGKPANVIAISSATNVKIYDAMNLYKDLPIQALKAKIDTLMYKELSNYPKELLEGRNINDIVDEKSKELVTPWLRYFIPFNPSEYLSKVTCPVLALNGTLDMQVQSRANLAGIKANLQKAGNTKYEIVPLTGLNHFLQSAKTGGPDEYGQIEETVNPIALQKVLKWIDLL